MMSIVQASSVVSLITGTALTTDQISIITSVTDLSASTINMSWTMTTTLRNTFIVILIRNTVHTVTAQLAAVDLVTRDVIVGDTETLHKTVPDTDDIVVIVDKTTQLFL